MPPTAGRTTNFISAFDPAGNYSADHSLGADYLNCPIGLAFDPAGDLHVANYDGYNIATFDAAGVFQGAITQYINAPTASTRTPRAICTS